jgi:hypothetical protein
MSRLERVPADVLAWLQERVIERDGCWVWTCAMSDDIPRASRDGKTVAVRRYIYDATQKRALRRKECAVTTCDTFGCVHPNCIVRASRSSRQKGRKQSADHTLAITQAMRARSKYSDEVVVTIRTSDEPPRVLSERFGMDESYAAAIRAGKVRKDYSNPFAGLFTGLLASNDSGRKAA